jgi:hypothetical protein
MIVRLRSYQPVTECSVCFVCAKHTYGWEFNGKGKLEYAPLCDEHARERLEPNASLPEVARGLVGSEDWAPPHMTDEAYREFRKRREERIERIQSKPTRTRELLRYLDLRDARAVRASEVKV